MYNYQSNQFMCVILDGLATTYPFLATAFLKLHFHNIKIIVSCKRLENIATKKYTKNLMFHQIKVLILDVEIKSIEKPKHTITTQEYRKTKLQK